MNFAEYINVDRKKVRLSAVENSFDSFFKNEKGEKYCQKSSTYILSILKIISNSDPVLTLSCKGY